MLRFGLRETSEKTIEINTLSDLTSLIERVSKRRVTLISPTQADEQRLGFDEIVEGLPAGQGVAFQFKRPYSMNLPHPCVKFTIDVQQLQTLLNNFLPHEAYYVFVPYPFNNDVINNRRNILQDAVAVDVYGIPKGRKTTQLSRTLRYTPLSPYTMSQDLQITDPRTYEKIRETDSLKNIVEKIVEGEVGFKVPLSEKRKAQVKEKKLRSRKLFYVHVASE
jgi:hypothetical protein